MTPELNKELIDAIQGNDQIEVVNPQTGQRYVIIESSVFELTQRQKVHEAIQRGIDDMNAGRTMDVEESRQKTDQLLDQSRQ